MALFLPFISVLCVSFGKGQNDGMPDDSLWTHCWVKPISVSLKSQLYLNQGNTDSVCVCVCVIKEI